MHKIGCGGDTILGAAYDQWAGQWGTSGTLDRPNPGNRRLLHPTLGWLLVLIGCSHPIGLGCYGHPLEGFLSWSGRVVLKYSGNSNITTFIAFQSLNTMSSRHVGLGSGQGRVGCAMEVEFGVHKGLHSAWFGCTPQISLEHI